MSNHDRTTRYGQAKGTEDNEGNRMIAVRFDGPTFKAIAAEAQTNCRSFAEQIRIYVGLGREGKNA